MRKTIICVQCGQQGKHAAYGLCNKCYKARPHTAERGRKQALEWYYAHAKQANARQLAYRRTPEGNIKRNITLRKSYRENSYKRIASVLKYQKRHPDRINAKYHRYRSKARGVPGSHTHIEWKCRLEEFNNYCAYCLKPLKMVTKDHMTPISKGKLSSNSIDNIVPCCIGCNSRKCGRTLLQFVLDTNGNFIN